MDTNKMLADLTAMQKRITESDPLLKRGIGRDWVVVVSPAIIQNLAEFFNKNYASIGWYSRIMTQDDKAQVVLGRKMYIENRCGMQPEYMTQDEYFKRYPELPPFEVSNATE